MKEWVIAPDMLWTWYYKLFINPAVEIMILLNMGQISQYLDLHGGESKRLIVSNQEWIDMKVGLIVHVVHDPNMISQ